METQDWFIVSLDSFDSMMEDEMLLREVSIEYMEKPVRTLLEYMLNPNQDERNPPYNVNEREVADLIRRWMVTPSPKDAFVVAAKSTNGHGLIPLDLDERVNTYKNQIVQNRALPGQDPPEQDSPKSTLYIELYARQRCDCRG